jgi:WD40 repeat protein
VGSKGGRIIRRRARLEPSEHEHQPTTIRQLATSWTGGVIAAAEFERTVHLYDLSTRERLRTIETTLDFGGLRLAISRDGRTVVVGAYQVHGIAAYSGETGAELWRRKDLKKVQQLNFNGDDSRVLCCFDSGPCESLNAQTGKSGKSLRGVRGAWESPYAPARLLRRSRDYTLAGPEGSMATVPAASFGALSVAFSKSLVCLSEAGGPVRALDLSSGTERWRHTPPRGTHFLRVAFVESSETFVGVSWCFARAGSLLLQRFEPDGSGVVLADIGRSTKMEFASRGEWLITDAGSVYESISGKQAGSLPFPVLHRPARVE